MSHPDTTDGLRMHRRLRAILVILCWFATATTLWAAAVLGYRAAVLHAVGDSCGLVHQPAALLH